MEPIVVLNRLQNAELPKSSLKVPEKSVERRKRKKNPKLKFSKRKFYYLKPFEKLSAPVIGFQADEEADEEEDFLGFTDEDKKLSDGHLLSAQIDQEDLVTFPRTQVLSICPDNDLKFSFTVLPFGRTRLRVLSLCDGIGTLMYVLQRLRVQVEIYFACEISDDAISVSRKQFPGMIIQLGCMKQISENYLKALGPIHLLCCGPPCDQITLLNGHRKEFNSPDSSAFLIYNFKNIRDFLVKEMYANKIPFLWFLETTAHMSLQSKDRVTSVLGCQPHVLCGSAYLGVFRRRLFFGNIPGMDALAQVNRDQISQNTLQSHLEAYRVANQKFANCITSNRANEKLPVTYLGKKDTPHNY